MFKRLLFPAAIVAVLVLLAACANPELTGVQPKGEPIKVGGIFDLSGPTADVAGPYMKGIQGYVQWVNHRGGIHDRPLQLIYDDYGYKTDKAEQLYNRLVNEDKVVAVQGWGTGDTEALRSKVATDKIPFMSAAYPLELADPQNAPYNFLVGTTYADQLIMVLQWIKDDAAKKGVAPNVTVFHSNSAFGTSPLAAGKKYADANGIPFSDIPMPPVETQELSAVLAKASAQGVNYAIIQNTPLPASQLVKAAKLPDAKGNMQFICLNWCTDELFIKLAGGAAEGVMGLQPFSPDLDVPGARDVVSFLRSKGSLVQDVGMRYLQGWWTMAVMAEGIKRTLDAGQELTGENIHASLEGIKGFSTGDVTGPLTFSPVDHRGNDTGRLYQVKSSAWEPVTDFLTSRIPINQ